MRRRVATVLHTREMEPITVVEMPVESLLHAQQHGSCRVVTGPTPPGGKHPPTLTITARRVRGGWVYLADDEALALPAAFLPGQRKLLRLRERATYLRGVMDGRRVDR